MPGQPYTAGIDAFNAIASTYEAWFASSLGKFVDQQELQALARVLHGRAPGTCIDIGAGTGHIAAWLAGQGHRVTAVEPSGAMRQEGRQRIAGLPIHWCEAYAERLPFADASFDWALLFTTLEFVRQPAQALSEAFRVVRPAGQVIVGFLHALSPWVALYRYKADRGAEPWRAATFLTGEEIEGWIGQPAASDEGLEVEQAIEGSNESELKIEQAWIQYDIVPWLNLRAGAVLVPVGRFNLMHDDNRWNLPTDRWSTAACRCSRCLSPGPSWGPGLQATYRCGDAVSSAISSIAISSMW